MGSSQILLVFWVIFLSPQHATGNTELRALMELKFSLDPENKILSSWTSDGDPCGGSFRGVACNEHRKVANISLQGKGLSGRVSPALAELKCLSGLYLHYNNLTGDIPKEIFSLTELTDLYLNVNNLSGAISPEIENMASLQVLELCCNQLTGYIPTQMGALKSLSVLALQYNRLTGSIPLSLGNLRMLRRVDLGFNHLSGTFPTRLANVPQLQVLDIRNNTLSGFVPSALRRLNERFQYSNNPGLCGVGFPELRVCNAFDNVNVNQLQPAAKDHNNTTPVDIPQSANIQMHCKQTHCSHSSKIVKVAIIGGGGVIAIILAVSVFLAYIRYRRRKQKIGSSADSLDDCLSTNHNREFHSKSASPLVSLDYCKGWDPLADSRNGIGIGFPMEYLNSYRINLEDIESATQYFSEANLLGRSSFTSVYKGILRDGSLIAVKSINITSCKPEEAEFLKGLDLITSLKHENLVRLRGFCCSRGRGECFLVYDFAPRGNLSQHLDLEYESSKSLDWSTRISIVTGITKGQFSCKSSYRLASFASCVKSDDITRYFLGYIWPGIGYLHSNEFNKPTIIHKNISVEKILLDQQHKPLISDSGLPKLLTEDADFSTLKASAAMGYLAPEYITTGRFTEKSDTYAFGVIILQILSGKQQLTCSMRLAAEACKLQDIIDSNLNNEFSPSEAVKLVKIAVACTEELPDQRPTMQAVLQELAS